MERSARMARRRRTIQQVTIVYMGSQAATSDSEATTEVLQRHRNVSEVDIQKPQQVTNIIEITKEKDNI